MDSHAAEKAQMDSGKYAHLLSRTLKKSLLRLYWMINDELRNPKCG